MKITALVTFLLLLSIVSLGNAVYAQSPSGSNAPAASTAVTTSTATVCVPTSFPFIVTGTEWGTSGASFSPGPGSQNVPLTVTLLYTGGCALTAASFKLSLSQPLAGTNGAQNLANYEVNLASDSVVSETYYVDVMSSASLKTYTFPLNIGYNTSSFAGLFHQTLNVNIALKGTVDLSFTSNVSYLYAGTVDKVNVSITNSGSGNASLISPVATSSGQTSILDRLSRITELSPDSTATQTLSIFVPSSLLGSAVSVTLSASYDDAYSVSSTATQMLGFYVTNTVANTYLLSATQVNNSVVDGVLSTVGFKVTNAGTGTINSPTFQLSAPSPLVVMSTSPSSESSLAPGQTETYTAVVSAGPSSTPGVYGGTLSIGYTDQSGSQHTQSFPAGFVLTGTVQLIVQDELISQTSTSLSVSGSLLNEGGISAYYAQVTGSVRSFVDSNATAYFVGEIDPNSPVSFAITIPLSAPSRAQTGTVLLNVQYKDTFGNIHTFATSNTTSLESAEQFLASEASTTTTTSSSGDLAYIVYLIVIAAIVIVGVAGAVLVRRRRAAMKPAKEQKVI